MYNFILKIFFILALNILISSNILSGLVFHLLFLYSDHPIFPDGGVGFWLYVSLWIGVILLTLIAKICIFPVLYRYFTRGNYIFDFFEKIRTRPYFAIRVLFMSLVLDFSIHCFYNLSLFSQTCISFMALYEKFCFGGVFICYIFLIVYFAINQEKC